MRKEEIGGEDMATNSKSYQHILQSGHNLLIMPLDYERKLNEAEKNERDLFLFSFMLFLQCLVFGHAS